MTKLEQFMFYIAIPLLLLAMAYFWATGAGRQTEASLGYPYSKHASSEPKKHKEVKLTREAVLLNSLFNEPSNKPIKEYTKKEWRAMNAPCPVADCLARMINNDRRIK